MDQYADKLTEGQKALLTTYPDTYKMNVYKSRRIAGYPQAVYDRIKANATTADMVQGGNGLVNLESDTPFPIPQSGLEVIWNHILRYRGNAARRVIGQAPVTRKGTFTMVMLQDEFFAPYHLPDAVEADLNNIIIMFKQRVTAPARLAGQRPVRIAAATAAAPNAMRTRYHRNTNRHHSSNRTPAAARMASSAPLVGVMRSHRPAPN